ARSPRGRCRFRAPSLTERHCCDNGPGVVGSGMGDRPSGTVTFLFTDIEGSTRRWEQGPQAMRSALADHDDVLRLAVEDEGGFLLKHTGDGICAAFASASEAVAAATVYGGSTSMVSSLPVAGLTQAIENSERTSDPRTSIVTSPPARPWRPATP